MKTKIVAVLTIGGLIVISCAIGLKRTADMSAYALEHSCEWSWSGTNYGDDRDYICK